MKITAANVGDVICTENKSQCILIEDVTDRYVQYRQETGHQFATYEREIAGTVVRDQNRISEFHRNAELGAALLSAELSALEKQLNGNLSAAQREEAGAVMHSVKSMQELFLDGVSRQDVRQTDKNRRPSLDDIISKASGTARRAPESERKQVPGKDNILDR